MTDVAQGSDLWAWAREETDGDQAEVSDAAVTVVIVAHNGERWLPALLDSLERQSLRALHTVAVDAGSVDATGELLAEAVRDRRVDRVVVGRAGDTFGASVAAALAQDAPGGWLWLLHDDAVADPQALVRLAAAGGAGADVVGPLLLEPRRRRGRAARVSEAGQTITEDGVITGVVAEGVLDQGQLEGGPVLGLNANGMLIRRSTWIELGGLDPELPSSVVGLEFCWRALLAGHTVITQPRARVVHVQAATRGLRDDTAGDPWEERRRWGLTLGEAFRSAPLSPAERGLLAAASTRRVVAYLAGKDLLDARLERRAVREWRADRPSVERLHRAYLGAVEAGGGEDSAAALRLTRRTLRSRRLDETFGRVVDWLSAFGDRGGGLGLDALTGDDFAHDDRTRRRLSPTWVLFWLFVTCAALASRALFSTASLSGPQLLPAPAAFGGLFARFTDAVAGVTPSSGAPWTGLLWAVSLLTVGHPDLVVGVILLAAVPLGFLLARRVLGRLLDDRWVALAGAALYALVPVVTGAVGSGQLGAVAWTLALPVLANLLLTWADDRDPAWPVAGGVALTAAVMVTLEPLTWLVVVVSVVLLGLRARGGWPRVAVAALGPVAVVATPFSAELARFPGRLLTGIEPVLAPAGPPTPLDVILGRVCAQAPPLWLSAVVFGALWALAVVGAVLRRQSAMWALAGALGSAAVAVVLTRLVVTVPPTGLSARPQATAWIVGMAALLLLAAAQGLDGLRESIATSEFGARHLVVYGAALVSLAALLAGIGWWVVAGHAGLERRDSSALPAFIRKDAARGTSRILALRLDGSSVGWALLEDDLGHLGDAERGLTFGGDLAARAIAESVAQRLVVGAADERIVPDLQRLGVGYLWVMGASDDQRAAISNVPGLGSGAADAQGATWSVPDSGRLALLTGTTQSGLEPGEDVPPGPDGRVLVLAEPGSSTLTATVAGVPLTRLPDVDGRPAFAVPAAGGTVETAEPQSPPIWALVPSAALLALIVLAAPASPSRADARARAPRHVRGGRR